MDTALRPARSTPRGEKSVGLPSAASSGLPYPPRAAGYASQERFWGFCAGPGREIVFAIVCAVLLVIAKVRRAKETARSHRRGPRFGQT
uniref:Uncharacterized protein n=1 Tax=Steinernema glaseri TaxID=37863 RepID=A0A1I7XWM2_9BILA